MLALPVLDAIAPAASVDLDAVDGADAQAREEVLAAWLRARGSVLVGFSGGVDSAYLAAVAVEALGAARVLAVIGRSASYPAAQWAAARAVAAARGIPVLEVDTDELQDPSYAANPVNRCYFCKRELWARLVPIAEARGLACVVDGTNADDLHDHRPGARAAQERAVASPLAAVGLTKAQVRWLSRARGLPTWAQPSSPCLSSRLPYGTAVTPERLARVERAEAALRALGITGDLRVRYHGDLARVEVDAEAVSGWLRPGPAASLAAAVGAAGFARVALDLRGFRSGSLNVLGPRAREGAGEPALAACERLEGALAARGAASGVVGHGRLAVVTPAAPVSWDGSLRGWLLDAAGDAGFTHVAVALAAVPSAAHVGVTG